MPILPPLPRRISWRGTSIWTEATEVEIPGPVTAFLVDQLGLKKAPGLDGYFDFKNGQRFRHLALIRERYGFMEFADNGPARFRLTRWLYALCWSGDDHPGPLIERHLNFLGRYDFSLPDTVMNGGLRPLRNPTSAWDF
jgi:Domain of unknown function (DUF4158)